MIQASFNGPSSLVLDGVDPVWLRRRSSLLGAWHSTPSWWTKACEPTDDPDIYKYAISNTNLERREPASHEPLGLELGADDIVVGLAWFGLDVENVNLFFQIIYW